MEKCNLKILEPITCKKIQNCENLPFWPIYPNKINELVLCTAAAVYCCCSMTFFTSTSTANCSAICQGRMLIFSPK